MAERYARDDVEALVRAGHNVSGVSVDLVERGPQVSLLVDDNWYLVAAPERDGDSEVFAWAPAEPTQDGDLQKALERCEQQAQEIDRLEREIEDLKDLSRVKVKEREQAIQERDRWKNTADLANKHAEHYANVADDWRVVAVATAKALEES